MPTIEEGITTVLFLSITYVLYMILWPLLKKELPLFYFCLLRTYIHDSMATIEEGITTVLFLSITYVYT